MMKKHQKGKWCSLVGIYMVEMQTSSHLTVVNCVFQGVEGNSSAKTRVIIPKILEKPFGVAEARRF